MMNGYMYSIVSNEDRSYEFVIGYESAISRAEELDERFPDEEFTLYQIGRPISEIPEPDSVVL
jgi:hypothetical protein